jgi:hypothetical protein
MTAKRRRYRRVPKDNKTIGDNGDERARRKIDACQIDWTGGPQQAFWEY